MLKTPEPCGPGFDPLAGPASWDAEQRSRGRRPLLAVWLAAALQRRV